MERVEEWRDVVGYEQHFQVSNFGRIYSKRTNKILSQTISKTGYYTHCTRFGGRKGTNKLFRIHRLVAEAFIDNPENKPFVNHKDGNKLNNNDDNLEWCTNQENIQHAYDTGLLKSRCGTQQIQAKLTDDDVRYIRQVYIPRDKHFSGRKLAEKFGVDHSIISDVVNYKAWKHVK